MAWSVSINILSIDISTMLYEGLNDTQIASQTSNVKRCSEIICPGVNLGFEFHKDLNQGGVPFTSRQMQRRETIRVGAVDNFK